MKRYQNLYIFIFVCTIYCCTVNASPMAVSFGGTGNISFSVPYAVLCGGTSSITPLQTTASAGSSGQPLISAGAGALPAYGTLGISGGGTGTTSLVTGVIQSNGTVLSSLGIGSAEQVLQNVAGTVTWAFTNILQMVSTSTSALVTVAGTFPDSDAIPQITDGTEILSLAITPKSATSTLLILFATGGTPTGAASCIVALFKDANADAVSAQYIDTASSGEAYSGTLEYVVSSASTTTRTYSIRIGNAGLEVNGNGAGSRVFGGTASTVLIIIELE